jgi:hypothetical protein
MRFSSSSKLLLRVALLPVIPGLLSLLLVGIGICVSTRTRDLHPTELGSERYRADLQANGTPVQRDFANRVFRYGDPVEKLLAAHKPIYRRTDGEKVYFVFRPSEPQGTRGRTVVVIAENSKLVLAATSVERGPGDRQMLCFVPFLWLQPSSGVSDWELIEANFFQHLSPAMAVLGCPIIVGRLRQAGYWPD